MPNQLCLAFVALLAVSHGFQVQVTGNRKISRNLVSGYNNRIHVMPKSTFKFQALDDETTTETSKDNKSEDLIDKPEEKFLILGLNPRDPQDWITVFLTGVIVVNGIQIVMEIIQSAMSKST